MTSTTTKTTTTTTKTATTTAPTSTKSLVSEKVSVTSEKSGTGEVISKAVITSIAPETTKDDSTVASVLKTTVIEAKIPVVEVEEEQEVVLVKK